MRAGAVGYYLFGFSEIIIDLLIRDRSHNVGLCGIGVPAGYY